MELLVAHGVTIDATVLEDRTVLYVAAVQGRVGSLEYLLSNGATKCVSSCDFIHGC